MKSVWQDVLQHIRQSLSDHHFATWFTPVRLVNLDEERALLEVPNRFFKDWLTDNHLPLIEDTLRTVTGRPCAVQFEIAPQDSLARVVPPPPPALPAAPLSGRPVAPWETTLMPGLTFETFVVGSGNQFAHAAALAVAAMPAGNYNPLFIYGGVGLGKTHLLNAIGHALLTSDPGLRVCYLSAEEFMNELINSIRYERMHQFRAKYRDSCDALLIDDVQFIAGKERTQEEFFHTFNALHQNPPADRADQRQVSRRRSRDSRNGCDRGSSGDWWQTSRRRTPRQRSRFSKRKRSRTASRLPDEVAHFLAENIDSNIRRLEGSLTSVGAFASLTGGQITVALAERGAAEVFPRRDPQHHHRVDPEARLQALQHQGRRS